ncbi:MAG: ScpA family protein [Puniceicoccaceae bacterium]
MADAPANEKPLIRGFDHSVSLPIFEGPLDLLLFLIRKSEIDIYDIPIEHITHQYLEILRNMEHQRLEVAGEFFVMAATLMQIKSRLLLPKDEQLPGMDDDEEEEVDPRWELVQQLIEYKKFKEAAGSLSDLMEEAQNILFREYFLKAEEKPQRPLHPSDPIAIWNVFNQVLRRLSEKIIIGQIHDEVVTVAERMEDIIVELKSRSKFRFSELIKGPVSVHYAVSTFLALLELTRLRKIDLQQDGAFTDIICIAHKE